MERRFTDEKECAAYDAENGTWLMWSATGAPDKDGRLCTREACKHHEVCKNYQTWYGGSKPLLR